MDCHGCHSAPRAHYDFARWLWFLRDSRLLMLINNWFFRNLKFIARMCSRVRVYVHFKDWCKSDFLICWFDKNCDSYLSREFRVWCLLLRTTSLTHAVLSLSAGVFGLLHFYPFRTVFRPFPFRQTHSFPVFRSVSVFFLKSIFKGGEYWQNFFP